MPNVGEYHGCPFKTFKEETLTDFLIANYGLKAEEVRTIIEKWRLNEFQVACVRLWEFKHPNGVKNNVGNSPNAYYDSSLDYTEAIKGE